AALTAGTHALTAIYQGSTSYARSVSAVLPEMVAAIATTVSLSANPTPATAGQMVYLTASVMAPPAAGTMGPTGTVEFRDGATVLGTATVDASGLATFFTSSLPAGTRTLTAVYLGDTAYDSATSALLSLDVDPIGT